MKNIFYTLLVAAALASCNNDKLAFSAFTVGDKAGTVNIKVAEDGTITNWGKKAGTLGHNGTVTDATGRQTATLGDNGMLTGLDGNTLVHVEENGTMHIEGSAEMEWNDSGELIKGGVKTGYRLKPANDDSYRAASIIYYLYSGFFTR